MLVETGCTAWDEWKKCIDSRLAPLPCKRVLRYCVRIVFALLACHGCVWLFGCMLPSLQVKQRIVDRGTSYSDLLTRRTVETRKLIMAQSCTQTVLTNMKCDAVREPCNLM